MASAPSDRNRAPSVSTSSARRAVMQRSSKSMACLAAALAKAQAELTNPEKSLVATIRTEWSGRGTSGRSAMPRCRAGSTSCARRWASMRSRPCRPRRSTRPPVSSISRPAGACLGGMDCVGLAGLRDSETATPPAWRGADLCAPLRSVHTGRHRRRGDLDAPDLATPTTPAPGPEKPKGATNRRLNGGQGSPVQRASLRRDGKIPATSANPILGPEASAELRNRLLAELNDFGSGDEAAIWARRNLRVKNDLTEADARRIEEAFHARLAILQTGAGESVQQALAEELSRGSHPGARDDQLLSKVIDKSVLAVPEPRRVRDREHVKAVAKLPCLICGRQPSDAHHLRFAQHPALGRKVSDEFTVPLCRGHHREVHRRGDETAWWRNFGTDPTIVARGLWLETHPLLTPPDETGIDGGTSRVAVGPAKRDRSISKRGANYKTKPIVAAGRQ